MLKKALRVHAEQLTLNFEKNSSLPRKNLRCCETISAREIPKAMASEEQRLRGAHVGNTDRGIRHCTAGTRREIFQRVRVREPLRK